MGRTVPTFTNIIDAELASWGKYRRGLRKKDQETFDEMFRAAKQHLAENFYAMRTIPFESIIVSLVLEQHKRIKQLEQRVAELKNDANDQRMAL
ncbi:MAG TPA: hypothetical protein VL633_10625 [Bacteroidota bacterium]|jgi:hypothetical protein|nr:hypothetical protein [Bacteroidota bacterium]